MLADWLKVFRSCFCLCHDFPRGYTLKNWGGGMRPTSQNPNPIYDQNLRYSLPYCWFSVSRNRSSRLSLLKSMKVSVSPGGYSQKSWVGVCGPFAKTPTPFMTKVCDFPYPICDLTKNLILYLWPDPLINTLFYTCLIISYVVQTDVKGIVKGFVDSLIDNNEKVASSEKKKHTQLKTRVLNPYPI